MERALGAGQDHRHRGWVLQDEPAEQEPGREQGNSCAWIYHFSNSRGNLPLTRNGNSVAAGNPIAIQSPGFCHHPPPTSLFLSSS